MAQKKLSAKQRKFVAEYLKDGNGAKAAFRAGYTEKSAKVQASRMLTNANLRRMIDAALDKALETSTMTKERALKELEIIALADMGIFARYEDGKVVQTPTADLPPHQSRAIQELSQTETTTTDGKHTQTKVTTSFKLHQKKGALALWLKAQGHLKDQVVHSGDKENPVIFYIPENGRDKSN